MTKEEMDAATEGLQFMLDQYRDKQSWEGYPRKLRDGIAAITTLRAQLAEARAERDQMRSAIFGSSDYAPDLKCGNFVEMAQTLHAAQKGGLDRADRAEAALAAQIEVDAGIAGCYDLSIMSSTEADARAQAIARHIRDQPHDRTALDRHDAKTREKVLREAAQVLTDEIDLARIAMPQAVPILAADRKAILALIEVKP